MPSMNCPTNLLPLLRATAVLASLVFARAASAAVIFTDQSLFQGQLTPGYYTETFAGVADGAGASFLNFSSGGFSYRVSVQAGDSLWSGIGNTGSRYLSDTTIDGPLTITFTGSPVTAIGGNFFLTDDPGNLVAGNVRVTLSDGSTTTLSSTLALPLAFAGFTTDAAHPITSLTISTSVAGSYVTFDNLIVGQAIPEPSTYALIFGLSTVAFVVVRRRMAVRV